MTDREIEQIRAGAVFVETSSGIKFTATTDAALERSGQNVYQVYMVSAGGNQVVRLTHRNGSAFRPA